jgi:hypothetical protein
MEVGNPEISPRPERDGSCESRHNSQSEKLNVVDFVAVKATRNNKDQQGPKPKQHAIQSTALIFTQFQQASLNRFICFGSRCVDFC